MVSRFQSPAGKPARVVFWDIDGTIIEGSLERPFLKWLRRNGHVNLLRVVLGAHVRTLTGRWRWRHHKLAYIRGFSEARLTALATTWWHDEAPERIRTPVVEAVRCLKSEGCQQVILTGSPRFLAERLIAHLELEELIAAEPEAVAGHYTGGITVAHPRGHRKVGAAAAWLERHGMTWDQAVALADRHDDRFLLEAVRTAIAVYPDARLEGLAGRRGWKVWRDQEGSSSLTAMILGR